MNIGVIGAGAWGTALSIIVARGGSNVMLWSYDGNLHQFDGVEIPENLHVTTDIEKISDCDVWLMVTPAAFFRETMILARSFYNGQPIIICTKGAESTTGCFMSEILADVLPECVNVGVLSGPQFAAEVARGVPTGSTLAGNAHVQTIGKQVFNLLHLNCSDDIQGTQICGVGKNAVALICGYNSIASSGENERAFLLTCAWDEVVKIGCAMGAKTETFLDFCGIGDLFLSATSVTSRNFAGGVAIANGKKPDGTVEGIFALSGLVHRAEKLYVKTPILCSMRQKLNI